MARYNRINLDGLGVTENRIYKKTAADLPNGILPGQVVKIDETNHFVSAGIATDPTSKLYVVGADTLQGKQVDDFIEEGEVLIGNYMETGRSYAMYVSPGNDIFFDTPLAVNNISVLSVASPGQKTIAFSKENLKLSDRDAFPDAVLVRVRIA